MLWQLMRRAEGRELLTAYFVVLALTVVRAISRQLRAAAILHDPRLCPQVSYGIHNYLFDVGNDEANSTAAFNATLEDEKVLEQSELVYIFMVLFLVFLLVILQLYNKSLILEGINVNWNGLG